MGGEGLWLPALLQQGSVKVTSEAEPVQGCGASGFVVL